MTSLFDYKMPRTKAQPRTLHFMQITDDRFDKDIENLLRERIGIITNKLSALPNVKVKTDSFRRVTFGDEPENNTQYRVDFYVTKDNSVKWETIYVLVNSVCAVPYNFIKTVNCGRV